MRRFVRVLIDRSAGRELDYAVPDEYSGKLSVGSRVIVMVRERRAIGTVLAMSETSAVPGIRPILGVVGEEPFVYPAMMELAQWMASYYCAPLSSVMRTLLPPMIRGEKMTARTIRTASLTEKTGGPGLPDIVVKAPKQAILLKELKKARGEVPVSELLRSADAGASSLNALVKAGWVVLREKEVSNLLTESEEILPVPMPSLNPDQKDALLRIEEVLSSPGNAPLPILLHGVTGSGKTEVYLRAIARVLDSGKSALVLVPEIALTPQTVGRFRSRFQHAGKGGIPVAVLHSHLTESERRGEWMRLQRGEARIAIGARSAVFAPLRNLGLIIVDEEHEGTYKQEETPRYHARDVAVMRGRLEACPVILGSATPSVESYRNALTGKYRLLELPRRADGQILPLIRVVDLRLQGKRAKSDGGLSAPLQMAIAKRFELGEQTILFLNRRGFSTAVLCQQCGHVCKCPNCSLSLTLHRSDGFMACHLCGHRAKPPSRCPECRDPTVSHSGIGTQRVEESVRRLFPSARIARMDADSMTRRGSYQDVLGKFGARRIDILVGTQMIAKGLDFPNVTLVGIINADTGLHAPDFRAGERTFQLLTQVAGRAGRGEREGEVIVQTFSPASPAIQHARHHDYAGFFEQEISFRETFLHPPFTRMLLVQLRGVSSEKTARAAALVSKVLRSAASPGIIVSEAAPAPLERSHGQYRHQVVLKGISGSRLGDLVRTTMGSLRLPEGVILTLDIDPYSML